MTRWILLVAATACTPLTSDAPHQCLGAMLTASFTTDADDDALAAFVEERVPGLECYGFPGGGRLECFDADEPCGWPEEDAAAAQPAFEEALAAFDAGLDAAVTVEACACRAY